MRSGADDLPTSEPTVPAVLHFHTPGHFPDGPVRVPTHTHVIVAPGRSDEDRAATQAVIQAAVDAEEPHIGAETIPDGRPEADRDPAVELTVSQSSVLGPVAAVVTLTRSEAIRLSNHLRLLARQL